MNYITGNTIRTLREKKRITQKQLAELLSVSDKTVSKWETDKGLPDIGIVGELVDGEYYVSVDHGMTKEHYTSFFAYVSSNGMQFVKLYPEQAAECRFSRRGHGSIYAYCNRHGLYEVRM